MDISTILPSFLTILIIGCVCLVTLLSLGVTGFFLYRIFGNMSKNSGVLKTGISAPAVIIAAQDTGTTMNDSPQVRLTLQVTPAGRPPFQAVTTTFVGRLQVGMIVPGASVMVKYDPHDITNVAAIQSAMQAQDQYYEQLRRTGEEAEATILTVVDLNIRVGDSAAMMKFTCDVKPRFDAPFRAETQAAVVDTSREKYSAGKKVYVRYDPANKQQVALDRAA